VLETTATACSFRVGRKTGMAWKRLMRFRSKRGEGNKVSLHANLREALAKIPEMALRVITDVGRSSCS
jgi:hypothetical protein